ncbi:hypothetical protein BEP19_10275 [Ammoniphilus oxalaticus]|uniref:Uncharacterized protein n=1 Tax=Ammoniphilus oxalaticus TaxID=66863 RepID=A0A419SFS6_9BACL|nr:hypothetical protein [Ammoniphilus oxalaticus]RKD22638.1 hypothetical protein BEP19_10275 [Ammoniphilus oxalaticus]
MNKTKSNSYHAVLQRLTEIENRLDLMMEELEEIKQNTGRKKRKRLALLSKKRQDGPTVSNQRRGGNETPLELESLLNHPILKSMLQGNSKGASNALRGMDPNQLAKIFNNPMIQSMLKKL